MKILVATDGSKSSTGAVKLACKEALAHQAELIILHAVGCTEMIPVPTVRDASTRRAQPPMNFPIVTPGRFDIEKIRFEASEERIKEAEEAVNNAKKIADEMEVNSKTKIFRATPGKYCFDPKQLIVKFAEENGIDMIVLGCRGKTGISRILLGSVTEYVTKHAHCPVLICR